MTGARYLDHSPFATAGSSESAGTVAARWRAIARSGGDSAAIRTPEQSITFAQAAARVDDLARAILDTTPTDNPVAVEIESDVDSVLSMLAVWCAGRPLVLVDPFLPEDRRANILELSGAHLLTPATVGQLAPLDQAATPYAEPAPDDPAVLLFTSGSTGTPKGVVLAQRTPVNHIPRVAHRERRDHQPRHSRVHPAALITT
ncbi:AMP-binding protein [Gordonia alkanivorans]|uniref:Putative non-ribosomal peptide synthetase n=1 Tax=Gordonia alkanivorans NBRC 16433 TaxID=1027371 RepID=F9VVK6_9ACTN|nr:AMP-binding protein [Gordonia alkanivorans]GAA12635.1 putative non-ribosomal peptide synthetase [Gordonia alkanivorans NBRC 16433]